LASSSVTPSIAQPSPSVSAALSFPKDFNPADILPWLPCTLALEIPLVDFTVSTLLKLAQGSIISSVCHQSSDIPLNVNGVHMAWTEFEVVGERLAARITDLV
jgi:flagellar motor switch/type III secretory pathway protein FliN